MTAHVVQPPPTVLTDDVLPTGFVRQKSILVLQPLYLGMQVNRYLERLTGFPEP